MVVWNSPEEWIAAVMNFRVEEFEKEMKELEEGTKDDIEFTRRIDVQRNKLRKTL